ncbi:transposase [Paenibacillus crassostreae]|uniref:Transposase n=1 Tax=Paenibacillus crassostreae TaxID=1763538 RepID=A0A167DPY4_9BACL|nr:transposase [Paenibacillus crassostreae]OAB74644.1 transposase [Paenibacillus crassostreae]
MSKFTVEHKIDAVDRYQKQLESVDKIARSIGANKEVVRMWIKQYEYHGLVAFEKSYTSYTTQFKMDVLHYMNENGASPNEAAVIFNISSPALIRKWRIQLSTIGIDALFSKKKGRPSMIKKPTKQVIQASVEGSVEVLEARIKQLEMENEYLKKLNALVQNKEKSPTKTKRK